MFAVRIGSVASVLALVLAAPLGAQVTMEHEVLPRPLGAHDFARAVDVSGDVLAVGSIGGGQPGVHVYERADAASPWQHVTRLAPTVSYATDFFGDTVAVDGDTIVVGAHLADVGGLDSTGAAFVFVRGPSGWVQQAELLPGDLEEFDEYGSSVDVQGDTALVGSIGDDAYGPWTGAVYVFERTGTTWTEVQKLLPPSGAGFQQFGGAVALDGNTLIGAESRRAWAFVRSGGAWVLEGGLSAESDHGLSSVDLVGDRAVLGDPRDSTNGDRAGAAHVFERQAGVWTRTHKLLAAGGAERDLMGIDVATDGENVLVGASGLSQATEPGSVYVFRPFGAATPAAQFAQLVASDGQPDQRFGWALAIQAGEMFVGAWHANGGELYCYDYEELPRFYCQGKPNSAGCVPFLATHGAASTARGLPFHVQAVDVPLGTAGLLLYGTKKSSLTYHGGTLCVGGGLRRVPTGTAVPGSGACPGALSVDFTPRIQSGLDPALTVGHRVFAQVRYRDGGDPAGFGDGLTNAVRFTIMP